MILITISILSPFIVLIAGFRNKGNPLWWYALSSLVAEISTKILRVTTSVPDIALFSNLFAITEFSIILLYYRNKVFKSNTLFYLILFSGITFFITHTTTAQGWYKLNRLGISTYLIVYIFLSISGLYTMLKEQKVVFLEKSSFFWANVAILIYSSGAFFLFLSTSHIKNSSDKVALVQLWNTLFLSLNILKNILLGIALSKKEES